MRYFKGWQALWKIPRVICEEMGVRFPTFVYGVVNQVLFKDLKAIFLVLAVQDNDIHLPERHEVNLQDLWPTKNQEIAELNIEKTADCIDQLRFFYTNVWMPWDNDNDDVNWVEKHLESRIRFCYDIKAKKIKTSLTSHILTLLDEANYIQQRREYLEIGLSDDEELEDTLDKSQINNLMRLHLRLGKIKNEIEMLENPELRKIYEDMKTEKENCFPIVNSEQNDAGNSNDICYIVALTSTIDHQINLLSTVQPNISKNCLVKMSSSFQHVLHSENASASIYVCPGKHAIKLCKHLNSNGTIVGISTQPKYKCSNIQQNIIQNDVIIASLYEDSSLLIFDGDFTLTNLVLDCQNVRTGIIVKHGNVTLKNCKIIGDGKSSTQQGIVCSGNSNLLLEGSCIENFSTGLKIAHKSSVSLKNSEIIRCSVGVNISDNSTRINLNKAKIIGSTKCGIYADNFELINTESHQLDLKSLKELNQYLSVETSCAEDCIYENCASNILILNRKMSFISSDVLQKIYKHNDEHDIY